MLALPMDYERMNYDVFVGRHAFALRIVAKINRWRNPFFVVLKERPCEATFKTKQKKVLAR